MKIKNFRQLYKTIAAVFLILSVLNIFAAEFPPSNESAIDDTAYFYMINSTSQKLSYRFKAPEDMVASKLYIFALTVTGAPTFDVGLCADSTVVPGTPETTFLTFASGGLNSGSFTVFDIPDFLLTQGKVYHIVIIPNNLLGGNASFVYTKPNHKVFPLKQIKQDPEAETLSYSGSWNTLSGMPVFAIEESSGKHFGNPYASCINYGIYGAGAAGRWVGEEFPWTDGTYPIDSFEVYVRRVGVPNDSLKYCLYNVDANVTVTAGTLASADEVTTSLSWKGCKLPVQALLYNNNTYRIFLNSPNSTSGAFYQIAAPDNMMNTTFFDNLTYGGTLAKLFSTSDGGASIVFRPQRDFVFKFKQGVYCQFAANQNASLVLGQPDFLQKIPNNGGISASSISSPGAGGGNSNIFALADTGNNRVLIYTFKPLSNAQPANVVLGQPGFSENLNGVGPDKLKEPGSVFCDGKILIIADTGNNRVLIYKNIPAANGAAADVVVGQPDFNSNSPACTQTGMNSPGGVYYDGTRLYVADTGNNRVLIYNNLPWVNGAAADIVLGQTSFTTASNSNTASGLYYPKGIHTDGARLVIADTGNNRVVIHGFIPNINNSPAHYVIGQPSFNTGLPNRGGTASANTLKNPNSAWIDSDRLYVADTGNNRILIFNSIPMTYGPDADVVLGQPDFTSNAPGVGVNKFDNPYSAFAYAERIYVSDQNNNRIMIFDCAPAQTPTAQITPTHTFTYTPTPTPVMLFGNKSVIDSSSVAIIDDNLKTLSYRFTAPNTVALDKIRVYILGLNLSPKFDIGIQADDGTAQHTPNGNWISMVPNYSPSQYSWNTIDIPDVVLNPGVIYHVVIKAGTISGGAYAQFALTLPNHKIWPKNQRYDEYSDTLFYVSGYWNNLSGMPVIVLEDKYGTNNFGNPYIGTLNFTVHGNDTSFMSDDDRMVAEEFPGPYSVTKIASVKAYLKKVNGPTSNLMFCIKDLTSGTDVVSGVMAYPAEAPDDVFGWVQKSFPPVTLFPGKIYRLYFYSDGAGSNSSSYYQIEISNTGNSALIYGDTSYGGFAYAGKYSGNGGSTWEQTEHYDLSYELVASNEPAEPTVTPTATPYDRTVYFGNQSILSGSYLNALDSSIKMYSMRFTARETASVNEIRLYFLNPVGTVPLYIAGIQADNGSGEPDGNFIASTIWAPSDGWNIRTISGNITAGNVYHIVVKHYAGTVNAENCISLIDAVPKHGYIPYDQFYDPSAEVLEYNGISWTPLGRMPVFVIGSPEYRYYGNPYITTSGNKYIYGGGGNSSDDIEYGEYFVAPESMNLNRLGLYCRRAGTPADNLYYEIYDVTGNQTISSGIFATPAIATMTSWIETNLPSTITLWQGRAYRLIFRSPGSLDSSNCYIFAWPIDATGLQLTYNGVNAYSISTVNGGLTWTDQYNADINFRLIMFSSGTPTYTPTKTLTATSVSSFTMTPTLTITKTFTLTATGTATETSTGTGTTTVTITSTFTGTMTPTATGSYTVTVTSTNTPENTFTVTGTATPTVSRTFTKTATETVTATATETISPTNTSTVTQTVTGTITLTVTHTVTATATETVTGTQTASVTQTNTPSVTQSATATVTLTSSDTETPTNTSTHTETFTPTHTATYTYTYTFTNSPTETDTPTNTHTYTATPTFTKTYTATYTYTYTFTFTPSHTFTATHTFTNTATPNISRAVDRNVVDLSKGEKLRIRVEAQAPGEKIRIKVYNLTGEPVADIEGKTQFAGWNEIEWDCRNKSGKTAGRGMYFIYIEHNGTNTVKKVFITK